jgi:hypothetical protein
MFAVRSFAVATFLVARGEPVLDTEVIAQHQTFYFPDDARRHMEDYREIADDLNNRIAAARRGGSR